MEFKILLSFAHIAEQRDKNWCWNNLISQRVMMQTDNIRMQLRRQMEKFGIEPVSVPADHLSFHTTNIQMALVNGYFMQFAYNRGERGK
jgi:hypothetical protein